MELIYNGLESEATVIIYGKKKPASNFEEDFLKDEVTKIQINPYVKTLYQKTFMNYYNCKEIIIPKSVTEIESQVFAGCKSLESIELHNDIYYIGTEAFKDCTSLKNVVLPKNPKYDALSRGMFENCTSITEVDIPSNIIKIGPSAFYNCKNLSSVKLKEGMKYIKPYAFSGCDELVSIDLPESIKHINWSTFTDCKKINKDFLNNAKLIDIKNSEPIMGIKHWDVDPEDSEMMQEILAINPCYYTAASKEDKEIFLDAALDGAIGIIPSPHGKILQTDLCDIRCEDNKYYFFMTVEDYDDITEYSKTLLFEIKEKEARYKIKQVVDSLEKENDFERS